MKASSAAAAALVPALACGGGVPASTSATIAGATTASAPGEARTAAPPSKPAIVQAGNAVLRGRAGELAPERIATPEIQALIERMVATMRAAPGVGLAAPQIGVPLRIIVLEDRDELQRTLTPAEKIERQRVSFGLRVLINPELRLLGDRKATFFEGCLSVTGFAGLVERSLEVEVTGLDERGAPQTWRASGWPARILQHEVDHLNGTLYIDRMLTRSFSTVEQAKVRFAGKPIANVLQELGNLEDANDPATKPAESK